MVKTWGNDPIFIYSFIFFTAQRRRKQLEEKG